MRAREVFYSGIVLSISGFVMRAVSVGFNVYVSGKIGAAGMGLLSLIMSVYSLAVTFASSGISLGATRMVAEAAGSGKPENIRAAMKKCLVYAACFGALTFLTVYLGAEHIGTVWLGDSRSVLPLKIFAASMLPLSLSCAMNGYFTALRRVIKSSSAQFFEQLVRISATVFLLGYLNSSDIERACIIIITGSTLAEMLSCVYTIVLYRCDIVKNSPRSRLTESESRGLTAKMLNISLPVAFSSYLRTGLVTLEHMLIPRGLKKFGASSEGSLESYGTLQAMVLPIVLFPSAFLSSFNLLMIPELAEASARGEKRRIRYIAERVMHFTLLFSIGAAAVMICFSHELGFVIYDSHQAADYIKLIAPLAPIMFADSAVDSMLKGLDEQIFNMKINIIDAAASALLVFFLCPRIGIMGYIITIIASEIFNLACSYTRLSNMTGLRMGIFANLIKPLICSLSACCLVRTALLMSNGLAYSAFSLTLHILLTTAVYFLLLLITNTLTRDDCTWLKRLVLRK